MQTLRSTAVISKSSPVSCNAFPGLTGQWIHLRRLMLGGLLCRNEPRCDCFPDEIPAPPELVSCRPECAQKMQVSHAEPRPWGS